MTTLIDLITFYINKVDRGMVGIGTFKLKHEYAMYKRNISSLVEIDNHGSCQNRQCRSLSHSGTRISSNNETTALKVDSSIISAPTTTQRDRAISSEEKAELLLLHKRVSFSDSTVYVVDLKKFSRFSCTCPNHNKQNYCYHIIAVQKKLKMKIDVIKPKASPNCGKSRTSYRRAAGINKPGKKQPTALDREKDSEQLTSRKTNTEKRKVTTSDTMNKRINTRFPLNGISNIQQQQSSTSLQSLQQPIQQVRKVALKEC
ncbi:unnamed protein product [Didymodactylos carnosus]|uniref:SWIM-type domain-containing protein n=1 Tax=Didymodactylos carnosus TaxID=1234261 RepID=A0A8S2F947_9BILA|nr:unnamed protein product [Didymodactylos carnosus]CAF4192089.1 unnamed protein product [Didymodactylos carnosus]